MNATITTLTIQSAAKQTLINAIMDSWGRFQPFPVETKLLLEADSFENLQQFYADILSGRIEI